MKVIRHKSLFNCTACQDQYMTLCILDGKEVCIRCYQEKTGKSKAGIPKNTTRTQKQDDPRKWGKYIKPGKNNHRFTPPKQRTRKDNRLPEKSGQPSPQDGPVTSRRHSNKSDKWQTRGRDPRPRAMGLIGSSRRTVGRIGELGFQRTTRKQERVNGEIIST